MSTFEVYLLKRPGADSFDGERVLDALLAEGLVLPSSVDPVRAFYKNPDTGVFFYLTLATPLASLWRSRLRRGKGLDGDAPDDPSAQDLVEAEEVEGFSEMSEMEEIAEEDEADDDDEEGEEKEPPFDVEMTPLALTISLLSPAFFAGEALAFADRVAQASDLHLDHPEPPAGGGEVPAEPASGMPGPPATPQDIYSSWDRSRRELVKTLLDQKQAGLGPLPEVSPERHRKADSWDGVITVWSLTKAEAWWRYGSARSRLEEELGDGIPVPLLQAAKHQGLVKTICDWEQGSPTVLPRTDLVLLRREKSQKGLFRTRKVMEEGIIPGEVLWDILAGVSEIRSDPVDLLIFREAANSPQAVAAKLETLELVPLTDARRTSLFGVIDFDPWAPAPAS